MRRITALPYAAHVSALLPLFPLFHSNQTSGGNGRVVGSRVHPAEAYMATPGIGLSR